MANLIFYENPEVIEEGFKPTAKEKFISNGVIDILGKDKMEIWSYWSLKGVEIP